MDVDFSKLYVIVDKAACDHAGVSASEMAKFFVNQGVPFLQYRDKTYAQEDGGGNGGVKRLEYHKIAWGIRQITWSTDTKFIVNDNVQYALDLDADGVHLGQEDLSQLMGEMGGSFHFDKVREGELMKERMYKEMLFGVSTHSVEQASFAASIGADYIGVGPIFETPTKPNVEGIGVEVAREMVKVVSGGGCENEVLTVGIGGINLENMYDVFKETGVDYFSMVRGCTEIYTHMITM